MYSLKRFIPNRYKRVVKLSLRNCWQSLRYYVFDGRILGKKNYKPKSIVFVCKGNVCRSSFAEVRLRKICKTNKLSIDSCGLDVDQGNYPPTDSVLIAKEFGCRLEYRRAKSLHQCNIEKADLILPMEYGQYQKLLILLPEKKKHIRLLREFAPFPFKIFCNIDDPYGWGTDTFRKSFWMIEQSLRNFI